MGVLTARRQACARGLDLAASPRTAPPSRRIPHTGCAAGQVRVAAGPNAWPPSRRSIARGAASARCRRRASAPAARMHCRPRRGTAPRPCAAGHAACGWMQVSMHAKAGLQSSLLSGCAPHAVGCGVELRCDARVGHPSAAAPLVRGGGMRREQEQTGRAVTPLHEPVVRIAAGGARGYVAAWHHRRRQRQRCRAQPRSSILRQTPAGILESSLSLQQRGHDAAEPMRGAKIISSFPSEQQAPLLRKCGTRRVRSGCA